VPDIALSLGDHNSGRSECAGSLCPNQFAGPGHRHNNPVSVGLHGHGRRILGFVPLHRVSKSQPTCRIATEGRRTVQPAVRDAVVDARDPQDTGGGHAPSRLREQQETAQRALAGAVDRGGSVTGCGFARVRMAGNCLDNARRTLWPEPGCRLLAGSSGLLPGDRVRRLLHSGGYLIPHHPRRPRHAWSPLLTGDVR